MLKASKEQHFQVGLILKEKTQATTVEYIVSSTKTINGFTFSINLLIPSLLGELPSPHILRETIFIEEPKKGTHLL